MGGGRHCSASVKAPRIFLSILDYTQIIALTTWSDPRPFHFHCFILYSSFIRTEFPWGVIIRQESFRKDRIRLIWASNTYFELVFSFFFSH